MKRGKKPPTKKPAKRSSVAGYSNFGGGGPFSPMGSPRPLAREGQKLKPKRVPKKVPKRLPTLAECEKAIGEKAETWVARCYEISCAIVEAGLVEGEAVYGHWLGPVQPKSHFADRGRLPFIPHGWILLKDGEVLDPTRWVFEAKAPYLYVGLEPDDFTIDPCDSCGRLREEHDHYGDLLDGDDNECSGYKKPVWPYDEGGNRWREAMTVGQPKPVPEGPRRTVSIFGPTANWVEAILDENNASELTTGQLFYLANFSYPAVKRAVGPEGVKMIYTAIADLDDTSISWIPMDNLNRARRECGFDRV